MDENETQQLAVRQEPGHELTVEDLIAQMQKIRTVMEKVMVRDDPAKGIAGHYGVIPGTNKPTLLKPGAEKLCLLFRLDPEYAREEIREGDHLTITSVCTLYHIPTGRRQGSGMGSCSTRESKYAYRKGARRCPECGRETIIKGKAEYGGGWLCFGKKGGCGTKFADGDATIEGQNIDRVANEDLPDQYNTVLKMANKRALVAAVLNATAASDTFTQDLEDRAEDIAPSARPEPERPPPPGSAEPDRLINEKEVRRLSAIATGAKWSDGQLHDLIAGWKYASRKDIRLSDYDQIVDRLKRGAQP